MLALKYDPEATWIWSFSHKRCGPIVNILGTLQKIEKFRNIINLKLSTKKYQRFTCLDLKLHHFCWNSVFLLQCSRWPPAETVNGVTKVSNVLAPPLPPPLVIKAKMHSLSPPAMSLKLARQIGTLLMAAVHWLLFASVSLDDNRQLLLQLNC